MERIDRSESMTPSAKDGIAPPPQATEFDVCVIGAGAAGLVLTEILSRDGKQRVCLLEAGPEHFRDRKEPFSVRSTLKQHNGVNEGRVTAFGGATNTWGGGLMRLGAADFEQIEGRPDTAWPVTYAEMVRHYEAVESLVGFTPAPEGPQNVFLENDDVLVRRREIPILPFRSKNFAQRFGSIIRARSNVTIHCNAKIVRFHPSPDGGLSHLDVEIGNAGAQPIRARRYVVSAGIVNTNLLAEQILESCGGEGDRPGQFFHDHLSFIIGVLKPKSAKAFSRRFGYKFERGLMIGEHFDLETKGVRLPGAFLHLSFDTSTSSILRPVREVLNAIQQRTLRGKQLSLRDIGPLIVGVPRLGLMRYLRRRLYLDPGTRILATLDLEQAPRREWGIEREKSGPDCTVAWDVSQEDAALAARHIPVCREILRRLQSEAAFDVEDLMPGFENDPVRLKDYLKRTAVDTFHSAGGLRMGVDPGAMVDSDLRLMRVKNVHVLSAAVFPHVGTCNPTHTILALAHRLGEHLLGAR
jgi:choline dehydrogenase-like flavoprotein